MSYSVYLFANIVDAADDTRRKRDAMGLFKEKGLVSKYLNPDDVSGIYDLDSYYNLFMGYLAPLGDKTEAQLEAEGEIIIDRYVLSRALRTFGHDIRWSEDEMARIKDLNKKPFKESQCVDNIDLDLFREVRCYQWTFEVVA